MSYFRNVLPAIIFLFGLAFAAPALAQTAIPTGLATLPAATVVNDADTFALCQNGPGSCSTLNYVWSHVSVSQIDDYLGSRSMALTNKIISGSNNTLTNLPAANINGVIPLANIPQIPTTDITGTLQAAQFPAITGDVSIFAGTLTAALPTVNGSPGSTTCSNITTNGKGLVTSNANGTCGGGTYTAGSGLQLVGSQFSVPSAGITSSMLAVGAASSNLGFTPLNPANNLSDVVSASTSRTNLGLGSLATLSSLPTTSLTGTLQAGQFPALTGDVTTIAGNLATTLTTVNAAPGSTTCSSVTTNGKGLVTSNTNGACGSSYTAGTGLQLIGSQFSVPSAGITAVLLASGVAASNLGYTPLNPANNLSDVALASTARTNLGLGSLATLSSLPTTSLTGTLQAGQFPALTGAVTTTAGSLVTTLAAGQAVANLGYTPLRPSNNLSDVVSAATSRTNLGLGSLATLSALPAPTASVLGGALSSTAAAHNFVTGLNTSGALTTAQPDFTDLSGSSSVTQITTALTTPPPIGLTTANSSAFTTSVVGSLSANPISPNDSNLLAVTGVINSGTLINYIGVGSFLKNDLASVGPGNSKNSVLFYGLGISDVSGAWTWGLNPVLNDTVGTTGDALVNEFDVNVGNASTTVYGLLLQGASTVQPTGIHPAIEVAPLDVQHSPSTISWGYGLETLGGAAAIGAYFGILTAGSTTSASQPIQFGYGNALTMSFSASSAGIFTVVPANATGAATGFATYNNGSSTANTASEFLMTTLDGTGQVEEIEVGSTTARLVMTNGGSGGIQISPGSGPIFVDGNTAVSCSAGTVSLSTLVVYKGLVTQC